MEYLILLHRLLCRKFFFIQCYLPFGRISFIKAENNSLSFSYRAKDILNIEIISTEEAIAGCDEVQTSSKVTVRRPIAKRAGRSVSECIPPIVIPNSDIQPQPNTRKTLDPAQTHSEPSSNGKISLGEIF